MKNDLFSIGPFTIHGYGLMIALGILACIALGMYRARKRNMSDEAVLDIRSPLWFFRGKSLICNRRIS